SVLDDKFYTTQLPGVDEGRSQRAPLLLVESGKLRRVKLVVQHAPLAPDEVDAKMVRLDAIDDRSDLADLAALEPEERGAGRGILVRREGRVRRAGRVA